jgi:hypothetical protein
MKKSSSILLTSVLVLAIASCRDKEDDWITGDENGHVRDTTTNSGHYRYFGGFWYPIYGGRINPGMYQGASARDIVNPGFRPSTIRTGGFGRSGSFGS